MVDGGLYECQVSYHDDVETKLKLPFNLTVLGRLSLKQFDKVSYYDDVETKLKLPFNLNVLGRLYYNNIWPGLVLYTTT